MLGVDEQLLALGFNKKGKLDVGVRNIFSEKSDAYILLKKYAWKMLSDLATRYPDEAQLSTETDKIKFYINGIWLFQFQFMWGSCYLTVTKRSKAINKYPGLLEVLNSSAGIIRKNNQDYYDIDLSKESLIIKSVELISNALNLFAIPNQVHTGAKESKRTYNMPETSLNQILYGPPGTGKTYHTVEASVKAAEPRFEWHSRKELKDKYDELVNDKRIRFVTFHQSYGYEEFVEGIKAKTTDDKAIEYVIENGVFQNVCDDAIKSGVNAPSEINPNGRVWKISLEGAHHNATKSYCLEHNLAAIGWGDSGDLNHALRNEYFDTLGKNDKGTLSYFNQDMNIGDLLVCINSKTSIEAVGVVIGEYQFVAEGLPTREDYCHQRQVKWLCKDISMDLKKLNDDTSFDLKTCTPLNRISVTNLLVNLAQENVLLDESQHAVVRKNYVLIIDEINRGNISKIFGELITLIEPSKRQGQPESIKLTLPYSGRLFSVPDNLYIIGTMNTADRSLALMDTALRRRFDFVEMMPDYGVLRDEKGLSYKIKSDGFEIDLALLLQTLNKRITALYDREHALGHAFLIPVVESIKKDEHQIALTELVKCFQNKIMPLFTEYFYEDWQKIRLVLGDNQKTVTTQLVQKNSVELESLFGDTEEVDVMDDDASEYTLVDTNSSLWLDPQTYIGIYNPNKLAN